MRVGVHTGFVGVLLGEGSAVYHTVCVVQRPRDFDKVGRLVNQGSRLRIRAFAFTLEKLRAEVDGTELLRVDVGVCVGAVAGAVVFEPIHLCLFDFLEVIEDHLLVRRRILSKPARESDRSGIIGILEVGNRSVGVVLSRAEGGLDDVLLVGRTVEKLGAPSQPVRLETGMGARELA